jgi:hypothetical protein
MTFPSEARNQHFVKDEDRVQPRCIKPFAVECMGTRAKPVRVLVDREGGLTVLASVDGEIRTIATISFAVDSPNEATAVLELSEGWRAAPRERFGAPTFTITHDPRKPSTRKRDRTPLVRDPEFGIDF